MGCNHRWGMVPFQGWGSMVTIFERWDESIAGVWCPFRAGDRWLRFLNDEMNPSLGYGALSGLGIGDCGF
ncbi:hypothetical protein [Anditalea andensis]|uniref:Uncharacterized protein n=1 Tax=Anditalea andensis TaxID=1048983 RepID=A0A074LD52_9BACT|nr:hypothetical protein [Anditalea andensis]KEO71702.1 hypothetical protein EL17_23150 [Anditalea andensis]